MSGNFRLTQVSLLALKVILGLSWLSAANGQVLFEDHFDTANLAGLQANGEAWQVKDGKLTGEAAQRWDYALVERDIPLDAVIEATVAIARRGAPGAPGSGTGDWYRYTVQRDYPGSEACLVLRSFGSGLTEGWWYRIELSALYGEIALHKGNGGYVQVVPAPVKVGQKHHLKAEARRNRIRAWLDEKLLIDYEDNAAPIDAEGGKWGVGVYGSRVEFYDLKVSGPPAQLPPMLPRRAYRMSVRQWRGATWIFSDTEPIARFRTKDCTPQLEEVKLLPGYQAIIHTKLCWGNELEDDEYVDRLEVIQPQGERVIVRITGHSEYVKSNFTNDITVSFDRERGTYSYRYDTKVTLAKDANRRHDFEYNYVFPYSGSANAWGSVYFDPLQEGAIGVGEVPVTIARSDDVAYYDWELVRGGDGVLYRVPIRKDWDSSPQPRRTRILSLLKPVPRPDTMYARGIHPVVNPAIEFLGPEEALQNNHSWSVCAFSHETHFSMSPKKWETEQDRTMTLSYRFVGVLPHEMARMFRLSRLPALPEVHRIKVLHKAGVNDFGPGQQSVVGSPQVANTWQGIYDVDIENGKGDNCSLLLRGLPRVQGDDVDMGWARARLVKPKGGWGYQPAAKYVVMADVRTQDVHGKGLYFKLERDKESVTHYVALAATTPWTRVGFVTDFLSKESQGGTITVGLDAAGSAWVDNLEVRPLKEGEELPEGISLSPQGPPDPPERVKQLPKGAIAHWSMQDASGNVAYDWIGGHHLALMGVRLVVEDGKAALLFDRAAGMPVSGSTRGIETPKQFSVETWIQRHRRCGKGYWGDDVFMGGARVCALYVKGGRLAAGNGPKRWNQGNFTADSELSLEQWHHVVYVHDSEKGTLTIYQDGEPVIQAEKVDAMDNWSQPHGVFTLGADYHQRDCGFWGLIGDTTIYGRALSPQEVKARWEAGR